MTTENWMLLARAAAEANNQQEVYTYYTKVLESDPANLEAWFGKAASAGWLSTLANPRLQEMVSIFQTAISVAPKDKCDDLKPLAADLINQVSMAVFQLAKNHIHEYPSLEGWNTVYSPLCGQVLVALEAAHNYAPTNRRIMENIVDIASEFAQGLEWYDKYDTKLRSVILVTPEIEETLKSSIEGYAAKIRNLNPEYQPPEIRKPTPPKYQIGSGGCLTMTISGIGIAILVLLGFAFS
jgi:hypothetical protein